MNTGLPDMLHYLNSNSEWQQEQSGQQPPLTYFTGNEQLSFLGLNSDQSLCELVVKPDPGIENRWNDDFSRLLNYGNGWSEFEMSSTLPRTASCSPNAAAGKQSCNKRKADKTQNLKVEEEEKSMEKKLKGCAVEAEQNSNCKSTITTVSTSTNKNKRGQSANTKQSKVNEAPRTDYIHVRARRGQATDSHSLAERVRREKISERMKYLQDLVPGCNKVTGKAGMLDQIINYVQSLQTQVEFLSMKLAAINPISDFDIEDYTLKEIFPASSVPSIGASSFQLNALTKGISGSSLEMVEDPMDATPRRTIRAPVSIQQTILDPSSLNKIQHTTWEDELQNLYSMEYHQGRSTSFISQPITGFPEENNVKL